MVPRGTILHAVSRPRSTGMSKVEFAIHLPEQPRADDVCITDRLRLVSVLPARHRSACTILCSRAHMRLKVRTFVCVVVLWVAAPSQSLVEMHSALFIARTSHRHDVASQTGRRV